MEQGAERDIYRKIEKEADRRRSATGFLIAAISNNQTAFGIAFLPDWDPTKPMDEVALYETVRDSLGDLVTEVRAGGCVTYSYENPQQNPGSGDPWVQVGWAKHVATVFYGSGEAAIVPHMRTLTATGQINVNNWLHQLGEETLSA